MIFPDWTGKIYSIVVEDSAVRNRLGPTIGTAFAEVYGDAAHPLCVPGLEEASGHVLCQAQPSGHMTYVLDGRWDGPDDVIPPIQVLSTWRIRSLMWLSIPLEDPRWVDLAGLDPGEGPALLDRLRQSVDDPVGLSKIVLYPITLRAPDLGLTDGLKIPDVSTFVIEYGRRLTPAFAAAVRNEPNHEIRIDGDGASLAGGRIRIAPACTTAACVEHRSGIVAVSMF